MKDYSIEDMTVDYGEGTIKLQCKSPSDVTAVLAALGGDLHDDKFWTERSKFMKSARYKQLSDFREVLAGLSMDIEELEDELKDATGITFLTGRMRCQGGCVKVHDGFPNQSDKLKSRAWERLKKAGFEFGGVNFDSNYCNDTEYFTIRAKAPQGKVRTADLILLFGSDYTNQSEENVMEAKND